VCRTNRPLRLSWTADPESGGGTGQASGGAWLGAPLVGSDGRNLGLIQLSTKLGAPEFTAGDEAVLLQLARMASVAIENARLYETALDTRSQLAWTAHVERVRAAELRAVINAMGEAVLVCDGAGRVNLVNPAADAMFAARPVETYEDLLARFRRPDGRPIDPTAEPVELQLTDRPATWVELRAYPVPSEGRLPGDPAEAPGLIAVMRDISAARQARAQREAFLGILSHELRTPITTIYAGSKVLAREAPPDTETGRELASDIAAEAERLFRLVEDLLVMTRIERGVLQLANEPVLLQRVTAAAIRMESAHWPSTRIGLSGEVDLPAVSGDATYVEQVVRNLLSNAAKYSPPDAEVEVRLEPGEDGLVSCRVLDRGRGFQTDETQDLFDLFYRSPATAAQAAGAGIGLFVCRRLVTAMGGRIWARPRAGGGAEFGFSLRRYGDED
jgi:K+-sensing histidine kinase KdpD